MIGRAEALDIYPLVNHPPDVQGDVTVVLTGGVGVTRINGVLPTIVNGTKELLPEVGMLNVPGLFLSFLEQLLFPPLSPVPVPVSVPLSYLIKCTVLLLHGSVVRHVDEHRDLLRLVVLDVGIYCKYELSCNFTTVVCLMWGSLSN